jgi:tetratricopeptide (TPR) repeat protein
VNTPGLTHYEAERAFDDLSSAVAINASAWQAYNGLGLIANKRGDHSAAIAHYDMALGINPDAGPVLNNRGYAKMLAYDYIGARTDLSRAARDLGYRQAWINLGALYAKLELYDQAVDAYGEVLPAPDALNRTAEASMRQGDYATAQALLEKAISLSPTYFPEAEENLLEIQAKMGGN